MIDWTKPIETVPCDRNPVPVPCEFVGFDENGDAMAFICGEWHDKAGLDLQNKLGMAWFFDDEGDPHYAPLPFIRNVEESEA